MRTVDINNNEVQSPDLTRGYLKTDKIFIKHHEAVEAQAEEWHYEVIAVYANGGQDIQKVTDVPAIEAQDAWDEYEEVYRYIEYTEDEIKEFNRVNNAFETRLQNIETLLTKLLGKNN